MKSEIVVPIYANKKLAAELDVESYFADTFTHEEQQFVEASANVVANFFAKTWHLENCSISDPQAAPFRASCVTGTVLASSPWKTAHPRDIKLEWQN